MISKNCNFQMLITVVRKVPQRSDATRNDRKGHLPSQKSDFRKTFKNPTPQFYTRPRPCEGGKSFGVNGEAILSHSGLGPFRPGNINFLLLNIFYCQSNLKHKVFHMSLTTFPFQHSVNKTTYLLGVAFL